MRNDQRLRRKVRRSYIVSTVSISLVLFLLGSVGYMLYGALGTAHTLRESVTLSAELENTLDEKAREKIEQQLLAIDGVKGVSYSPREEKINDEEFRRMFASEIEHILEDNPLRNSFEVAVAIAEKEQTDAIASDRKSQVGTGDRSERIRTYNYPQGRLTDHRIGLTLYKLEDILNGNLDEVIDALVTADRAEKLKESMEQQ